MPPRYGRGRLKETVRLRLHHFRTPAEVIDLTARMRAPDALPHPTRKPVERTQNPPPASPPHSPDGFRYRPTRPTALPQAAEVGWGWWQRKGIANVNPRFGRIFLCLDLKLRERFPNLRIVLATGRYPPSPARGRPIRGAIDNYVGCASFLWARGRKQGSLRQDERTPI